MLMTTPVRTPDDTGPLNPELDHMARVRELRQQAQQRCKEALDLAGRHESAVKREMQEACNPHIETFYNAVIPIIEKGTAAIDECWRYYRQIVKEVNEAADTASRELRMAHEEKMAAIHAAEPQCPFCQGYQIVDSKCMNCPGRPRPEKKPLKRPARTMS